MCVAQLAVLDEQGPAADTRPLAEEHALGASVRNLNVGRNGVWTVQHLRGGERRNGLGVGPEGVPVAWFGDRRPFGHQSRYSTAIDRQDVIATRLDGPLRHEPD